MANAWCINAYNCDWCLIQTLWTLDSANIWVWVQFCAPDPLDDKRLDYIKYTDKCWNTCCLSWENEILIYATQWTIKNVVLTNDDINEVVNVKRTDLFWSNWKKTVVRYKTGSYPTSITDWTLAVEELVQNQYQSSWYNVSWLSDWTTYYFSVFAVAQDDTIIVVQTNSITTQFWWWRDILSSTQCYYELFNNQTDKTGKTSLNVSLTKDSIWYRIHNQNVLFSWNNSVSTFCSFRIKVNSNIWQWDYINQVWYTWKWWMCYNPLHNNSEFVNQIQFGNWYTRYTKNSWIVKWTWYHVAFWFNWTQAYMYINWVKTVIVNSTSYRNTSGEEYRYILHYNWWETDITIADFIKDTVDRESDIITAFNKTKSRFWY